MKMSGHSARIQAMQQEQQQAELIAKQEARDAETKAQMDADRVKQEARLAEIDKETKAEKAKQEADLAIKKIQSTAPDQNDPALQEQLRQRTAQTLARGGRRSTILTSPLGATGKVG